MKKTLALLLALVLCFSAVALIACNKCDHNFVDGVCTKCGDKDPNYKPNGGDDNVDVPTVEGKVTLYFTLADESVTIPEYASFYFTGGQTAFATGLEAIEFTRLNESKVYYVQIEYDATKTQADEYAIVLGYNAASGLPADKQGLKWVDDYKSDECAAVAYPGNAKFTVAAGANKASLGKHTFSTEVAKPERINTTLAITFLPALPETAEVYFIGSFNEWETKDLTKSKATADANRETYSLAVSDVLCSTHYYKVLVFLNGTANVVKPLDGKGEEMDIWNWQRPDAAAPETTADGDDATTTPAEKKYLAYIEISAGDDNLPVDIAKRHKNSVINLAGTLSEDECKGEIVINPRKGLDILDTANLTEVEGKKTVVNETTGEEETVPNGIMATKYILKSKKTLVASFETALPDTAMVYVIGSFLATDWTTTVGQARMTIAEDRKSASVTYEMLPGAYEFQVIVIHKDIELNADNSEDVQAIWDFGTSVTGSDVKITISGFNDAEVDLFGKAQTVPTIKEPDYAENVVLKVTFDNALAEGKHVLIAGSFEGWKGTEMTTTDRIVWTLTLDKVIAKAYEFKVCTSDTAAMSWGSAYGKDGVLGAQANEPLTIAKDSTEIALYGTVVLEAPKAAVSTTLTITFAGSMEGKVVVMKGSMTDWQDVVLTTEDNITYSATIDATPGTHGFIIGIGATETEAKTYAVKVAGTGEYGAQANGSVTITEEGGTVALFGTTTIPVAPPAAE